MLLQCDPSTSSGQAGRIRLLPAWPAGWDADFKLHAPGQTTVSGVVKNGELVELNVSPASRRSDVVTGGEQR
jgi:alpha-L-fucosidase 2